MLLFHRGSGLLVVPSVASPERHEEVGPELVQKIIRILRKHCTLVICDVPPTAKGPATWATIEEADHAVVVLKPDVQDIKDLHAFYTMLARLNLTSKLNGVMNLVGDPRFFDAASIEAEISRLTGLPIIERLPFAPEVSFGVQRSQPYVLTHPGGEFTKGVKRVLNNFTHLFTLSQERVRNEKPSLFSFFRKVAHR